MNKLINFVIAVFASIILIACGGDSNSTNSAAGNSGNSGNSGGQSNNAPVINVSLSSTAANEGNSVTIDASGTTDADGDVLTYVWSQTAGPTISIEDANAQVFNFIAPEVNKDEMITFQLNVSDSNSTSTHSINFEILNVVLSPAHAIDYTFNVELPFSKSVSDISSAYKVLDPESALIETSVIIAGLEDNTTILEVAKIDDEGTFEIDQDINFEIPSNLKLINARRFSDIIIIGIDEVGNGMYFYDYEGEVAISLDVESPCSHIYFSDEIMIVGQSNSGAAVYVMDNLNDESFSVEKSLSFGGTRSLCSLGKITAPINIDMPGMFSHEDNRYIYETPYIIAFDHEAQEVVKFELDVDPDSGNILEINEVEAVSLQLNLSGNQAAEFVFAHSHFDVMYIIYTDGDVNGTHRLITVGGDTNGSLYQETYQWAYGSPVGVAVPYQGFFAADEIYIATENSPYLVVFSAGNKEGSDMLGAYLPLSGPTYMDVGLGVSKIKEFTNYPDFLPGILLYYPSKEKVVFLGQE